MIALGIMSGTSCDGVDVVAIELDPRSDEVEAKVLGHAYEPFEASLRETLLAPEAMVVETIAELHFTLPEIYARAASRLPAARSADCCGMHGQSLWHRPPSRSGGRPACSFQIGSSAVLAERLGVPVVGDFRGVDVALGGEGAPLVPFAHWFFTPPARRPRVIVNLGGIANITLVHRELDRVVGYDTGPGMMISDAHARSATNGALDYDRDGSLSRGGKVIPELVDEILAHPFVQRSAPKSTGREDFGEAYAKPLLARYADRASSDVALSILAATAESVSRAVRGRVEEVAEVLLTGGGAKNAILGGLFRERLGDGVSVADTGLFAPSIHEPAAFALFAARTFVGLPSSLPAVTGARRAARLGHTHWP